MGLIGELSTQPYGEIRKAARKEIVLGAGLRQRGATAITVQILDLSTHGFRAATHLELPEGTDVWLKLPGLETWHSRVVWMRGHLLGCEFVRPLHPAVLDMMVGKIAR
ncbi:PilZ domain-containing protein [Allosphingosinicella deserti]|uniref:Pilus assembly protein PilZ n=1 Tax=Allosphingosinicella deserti TaxID=2116704 RepID=A0A2P7QV70_9SPHN|nr:PilZ domain-containing protein [Sphingomonas deserti]PSJ41855.1 pilus assembly protein PilZ [Sphingomonas deserti]